MSSWRSKPPSGKAIRVMSRRNAPLPENACARAKLGHDFMLNRLADFLVGRGMPAIGNHAADEMHLAVAALLIEAARMDSTFDAAERASIEALLATKFNLDG